MSYLNAMQDIQTKIATITGIKAAPLYHGSLVLPGALIHLGTGEVIPGDPAGTSKELCAIVLEIHIAQSGSIADAFRTLEGFHPNILAKLMLDKTFGGNIQTYGTVSFTTALSQIDNSPTLARVYTINDCKLIN